MYEISLILKQLILVFCFDFEIVSSYLCSIKFQHPNSSLQAMKMPKFGILPKMEFLGGPERVQPSKSFKHIHLWLSLFYKYFQNPNSKNKENDIYVCFAKN